MTESALAGRRILIVEDEMVVAMLLEDMLEELGCEVVATATRPAEALAAIQAHRIDAAVLDLNLDGQLSHEVADALAARGVPFILSTGYSQIELKQAHPEPPVLRKPFRSDDLGRALLQVLSVEPER